MIGVDIAALRGLLQHRRDTGAEVYNDVPGLTASGSGYIEADA